MAEDMITLALSVLDTYMQKYRPQLTDSLLYHVVKTIIPKLGNPDLLEAEITQLTDKVVEQFKAQGFQELPPRADVEAIAAQVADEVDQFLHERGDEAIAVDVTTPQPLGDLEVGSALRQTPPPTE